MLKLLGCVLIMTGVSGFGLSISCQMRKHLEQLIAFQEILYALTCEMKHFKKPLAEAFDTVAENREGGYRTVLKSVAVRLREFENAKGSKIWEESFRQEKEAFLFTKEELDIILRTGHFLDAPDVETQRRDLEIYESQIEHKIEEIQGEIKEKRKIYMYGSVLGGIFLIILLI